MRVLIINEYTRGLGGVDYMVDQHIKCLEKNNIEYKVIKLYHSDFTDSNILFKIKTYFLSVTGNMLVNELRNMLKYYQPDIIHIHNIYPFLFKSVLKELRNSNSKIVYHLHNYYPFCLNSYFYTKRAICTSCIERNNWRDGIIRKCCDRSFFVSIATALGRIRPNYFYGKLKVDKYIAVSKFVKEVYVKLGFDSKKIDVIYNSVSPVPIITIEKRNEYVLYIGSLLEQKGLFTLIDAAKQTPEIPYKIVGDGKDKNAIVKYANGVNNITFTGSLYGEDKYKVYNGCKFVVVPSEWWETFGLVAIEGNSCGKYVLTTGSGGLTEIIDGNKNGDYYNIKNTYELVSKIRKLWIDLDDKYIKDDCINNAKKYSFDSYCVSILKLYTNL